MPDREAPGSGSDAERPGVTRLDAVERLRRQFEGKTAGARSTEGEPADDSPRRSGRRRPLRARDSGAAHRGLFRSDGGPVPEASAFDVPSESPDSTPDSESSQMYRLPPGPVWPPHFPPDLGSDSAEPEYEQRAGWDSWFDETDPAEPPEPAGIRRWQPPTAPGRTGGGAAVFDLAARRSVGRADLGGPQTSTEPDDQADQPESPVTGHAGVYKDSGAAEPERHAIGDEPTIVNTDGPLVDQPIDASHAHSRLGAGDAEHRSDTSAADRLVDRLAGAGDVDSQTDTDAWYRPGMGVVELHSDSDVVESSSDASADRWADRLAGAGERDSQANAHIGHRSDVGGGADLRADSGAAGSSADVVARLRQAVAEVQAGGSAFGAAGVSERGRGRRRKSRRAEAGAAAGESEDAWGASAAAPTGYDARRPERWTSGAVGSGGTEAQAKDICLRLLTDRARSRAELADRLTEKGFTSVVVERVLDRLAEVKLIDDAAFAEQWVRSRHTYSGKGKRALAQELRRKGISDEDAEPALSGLTADDEYARAAELVRTKLRTQPAGLDREKALRRLVGMLARRGYSSGLAYAVVKAELAAHAESAE